MFPDYFVLKVYANVAQQKGRRLAVSFSAWWGWGGVGLGDPQIPRQRATVSASPTAAALRPLVWFRSYITHTRTYTDTLTHIHIYTYAQTDAGPSPVPPVCSPTQSKFVYCNFWMKSEWFAIIGSVDEGQSLWGAVSVFRDSICFQALCLQLRKANVTRKPQKWKFVWTY